MILRTPRLFCCRRRPGLALLVALALLAAAPACQKHKPDAPVEEQQEEQQALDHAEKAQAVKGDQPDMLEEAAAGEEEDLEPDDEEYEEEPDEEEPE